MLRFENVAGQDLEERNAMEEDILKERYELAVGRIREMAEELAFVENEYLSVDTTEYFAAVARYLIGVLEDGNKGMAKPVDRKCLFAPEIPYEHGYLNPTYAKAVLGIEHGRILSWLLYELCSLEPFVKAGCTQDVVIRLELFLEVYAAYTYEWKENGQLPEFETIRRIMYWFAFDYADVAAEQFVKELNNGVSHMDGLYLNSSSMLYGFVPGMNRYGLNSGDKDMERCAADHQEDIAMILDKAYMNRKLEVFSTALERNGAFSEEQRNFLQENCRQMKKYVAHLA